MKLRNCERDLDVVMMADNPLRERAPEPWQQAWRSGSIPDSLFRFYANASYFSPDKAPPFLADPGRVLFSYLATVVECIRENLGEALDLCKEVKALEDSIYSPTKKARGERWDPNANQRQRRALRDLLLNLSSTLDLLSEIYALFFPGSINGLKLGKAQFSTLKMWLSEPLEADSSLIVTPQAHHRRLLHEALAPLIPENGSRQDWLSLFTLYRNKLAHFGALSFMDYRLHDKEGDFFSFLPRNWPFIWQQYLSWTSEEQRQNRPPLWDTIEQTCIHIDLIEFIDGARERVTEIIEKGFGIFVDTYEGFKGLELNAAALEDLRRSEHVAGFVDFDG
jgi:hypothetical protein